MFYLATKRPDVAVGTVLLTQKLSREQEAASEESSWFGLHLSAHCIRRCMEPHLSSDCSRDYMGPHISGDSSGD